MNDASPPDNLYDCRICGDLLHKWSSQWLGFEWGRCRRCRSVQKAISEAEYKNLNPTYDPGYDPGDVDQGQLLNHMDVDSKEALLRRMLPRIEGGRLLDIGCGMGGFLIAGRRLGMDVLGIEPSSSHSRAATELFGLNVKCGYFDSKSLVDKFDIIVLSHVLEHIHRPAEFLGDVVSVLAPRGRLLVITPNVESLAARLCGRYWSMFKPIDHVTMMGTSTVEYLVPDSSTLELIKTDEWNGEFAAHILSAFRSFLRPDIANKGGAGAAPPRGRSSMGRAIRFVLAFMSWPFRCVGGILGSRSCLYFVLKKEGSCDAGS